MFFDSIAHAMGASGQGGAQGPAGQFGAFLPLILMFAIFYFLLIRPQQKKAKQHKQMLAELKRGDRILTGGGLYGRITSLDGDEITVELAEGFTVNVDRGYIASLANPVKKQDKKAK